MLLMVIMRWMFRAQRQVEYRVKTSMNKLYSYQGSFEVLPAGTGRWTLLGILTVLAALAPYPAFATVYRVGPDQVLKTPSQAARIVQTGDTIEIEPKPGGYYDCAVWNANNLTIEGIGQGVRLTDSTCQGKAIFVTVGHNITIRNLTFARAVVPDWNGAGIRAEGRDLRIEDSRFIDNQSGILVADSPGSTVTIQNSQFIDNGFCGPRSCADSIEVGRIAELKISHSLITGTPGGDAIHSLATLTQLVSNRIEDGETGAANYLVDLPFGGSLIMHENTLVRGSRSRQPGIAVRIMQGVGAPKVNQLVFTGNTLQSDSEHPATFILNWTGTRAQLSGNHLGAGDVPLSRSGYLWFLTKSSIHYVIAEAKDFARPVRAHLHTIVNSILGKFGLHYR
ncbi:hypothetical protein BI364_11575 [Acidihalobacter yilgarnensis]|uniref:Right handed beta helix domain-containing protein n=1 Tax=Acidihalobacter yilgarnensis TaxID=2819280 RepID=A0A1D8IPZ3_9GAMM|nr:right-handed parallel beta-helix repeat-containing protein [Acidihalobacter yilgarnensis]AOU98506.1 hypothetical protein BI364_11575 [Acidihalobacter yilgarnensis]